MVALSYYKDIDTELYQEIMWCTASTPKKLVGVGWGWQIAPDITAHRTYKRTHDLQRFLKSYKERLTVGEAKDYLKAFARNVTEKGLWVQLLFFESGRTEEKLILYNELKKVA